MKSLKDNQNIQFLALYPNRKTPFVNKGQQIHNAYLPAYTEPDAERNIGVVCGRDSNNLFVIDFDDVVAYENSNLKHIFDDSMVVATKRGRHVYFFAPKPVQTKKFDHGDIKGQNKNTGSYVVAPGSIVNGYTYTIIIDKPIKTLNKDEFKQIADTFNISVHKKNNLSMKTKIKAGTNFVVPPEDTFNILPEIYKTYFRTNRIPDGKTKDGEIIYLTDRSVIDARLCTYLISIGFSNNDIFALYNKKSNRSSRYYEKGIKEQELEKFRAHYHANKSLFDRYIEIEWNHEFTDRSKDSLLSVYRAILFTMKRTGLPTVTLSIRDISLLTGIYYATIIRSISLLQQYNLLSKSLTLGISTFSVESILQSLHIVDVATDILPTRREGYVFNFIQTISYSDLYRKTLDEYHFHAMNKQSTVLVDYINKNVGKTVLLSDIENVTGMHRQTVLRKIRKLQTSVRIDEVAVRYERTGRPKKAFVFNEPVQQSNLDTIAYTTGTYGKKKERVEAIRKERENWRVSQEAVIALVHIILHSQAYLQRTSRVWLNSILIAVMRRNLSMKEMRTIRRIRFAQANA